MSAHKAFLITATVIVISMVEASRAEGIPVFYSWGGEKVIKVANFPDTEEWKSSERKHVDVGYRFKQISIFFVPIWNYDGSWCGYIGQDDHYLNLNTTEVTSLAAKAGINLPDAPNLPFWDSYGGKLLLLVVLLVWIGKSRTKSPTASSDLRPGAGS